MQKDDDTSKVRWQPDALAGELLSPEQTFSEIAAFPGDVDIELYRPIGEDRQEPHDRDELYFVVHGSGKFLCGEERVAFAPGDMLFVPAHVEHRFEAFSEDFLTWVVFFGRKKAAPGE